MSEKKDIYIGDSVFVGPNNLRGFISSSGHKDDQGKPFWKVEFWDKENGWCYNWFYEEDLKPDIEEEKKGNWRS